MEKDTRIKMADSIEAWGKEDSENRDLFIVFGDRKHGFTSCGYMGIEPDIMGAIVNEMFEDEVVARIIINASKVYQEVLEEEKEKKVKQDIRTKKTKKYLS